MTSCRLSARLDHKAGPAERGEESEASAQRVTPCKRRRGTPGCWYEKSTMTDYYKNQRLEK